MKLTTLAIATLSLLGYSSAFIPMSNINGPSSSPLASSTSLKVSNDIPEALRSQMSVEQLRKMEEEAGKIKAAQDADLDPWFSEAVAGEDTIADFDTLEGSMTGAGGVQDFLEATPYYDMSGIPINTYKNKEPFTGSVVSCKRIVGPKCPGEVCHIVINHNGDMPYWEGQSYGVIPPGTNPKNGKPHNVRLYSIASTRYGDDMTGKTGSLCVRRATYWCPEMNAEDPAKKGICSNYLCDAKPGEKLAMTGPAGKVMLMPESTPEADLIMVATGTGIAPYRGFMRRLFTENTPMRKDFKGVAWLFLGVANTDSLLYDDEFQQMKKDFPDNVKIDYALSREQNNKEGGKMYIQNKIEENADEVFERLQKGAHMYFCGLKGMMPGITETLKKVADSKGIDWEQMQKDLKKNHQWHVEVY